MSDNQSYANYTAKLSLYPAQAQATDRAHRIGQRKPVFVHKLIVAGSVEEEMMRLQRRKQLLADGLLGAPSLGATALTEDTVGRLFAPLEPRSCEPGGEY